MLKDYQWSQCKCKMIFHTTHRLHIAENSLFANIPHLSADQIRVLVRVPINLHYDDKQIVTMFNEKIHYCTSKFAISTFKPGDITFRCQHYWWTSLKYPSPVLLFAPDLSVLKKLHDVLLPKLGVIKTFPKVMRSVLAYLRGLNLHSAEVEALIQAMHHLISLPQLTNQLDFS